MLVQPEVPLQPLMLEALEPLPMLVLLELQQSLDQ
jgi:hypothetical protein